MSYAHFFRHLAFPAYERLHGRRTGVLLRECEKRQWWPRAQLERYQLEQLNRLLDHCWRNVPFLSERWRDRGLAPGPLGHVRELSRFPVTEKADIRAHYSRMVARGWEGRVFRKATGGSTGEPMVFGLTQENYAARNAIMWRGYDWAGAGPGVRTAYVWGTPARASGPRAWKDALYHAAFNRHFLDAFALTAGNAHAYLDEIERFGPRALVGYVAPLVELARVALDAGRKLRLARLRGIVTGAEALYPSQRDQIERAFGVPVFNTYGCREFMLMAAECPLHAGLHVNIDNLVVEVADGSQPAMEGASGEVLVTDLTNHGMPFVRYRNGDRATLAVEACACGRGLPLLASVDGRVLDLIRTPGGGALAGEYFVHSMLGFPQVSRFQAVQVAADRLEFRYVCEPDLAPGVRREIHDTIARNLGPGMGLTLRRVRAIPLNASGKHRVSVSLENAALHPAEPAP